MTLGPEAAEANCPSASIASVAITQGSASDPVSSAQSDMQFRDPLNIDYNDAVTYVSKGTAIRAYFNKTYGSHLAGSPVTGFSPIVVSTTMPYAPVLVPLGTTGARSLIVVSGSTVARYSATNGALQGQPYSIQRTGCSYPDTIQVQPAVQIRSYANSSFQSTNPDDLVIISTCYSTQCTGGTSTNKVVALRASDFSVQWESSTSLPLGCGSGLMLDYETNSVWATFQRPSPQTTLARLHTDNSGNVASTTWNNTSWTMDAGDLRVGPSLRSDRVFVVDYNTTLKVYRQDNLALDLSTPLAANSTMTFPFYLERRTEGGFSDLLLSRTNDGYVQATSIYSSSQGSTLIPSRSWSVRPRNVDSSASPTPAPFLGKAYVGGIDGKITQLTLANGAYEAMATVGTSAVAQPSLDFENSSYVNRMVSSALTSTGAQLRTYCIPFVLGANITTRDGNDPDAEAEGDVAADTNGPGETPCSFDGDPVCPPSQFDEACTDAKCIDGSCVARPVANGTPCTLPCQGTGKCQSGFCSIDTINPSAGCPCGTADKDTGTTQGCDAGLICCGAASGCVDLMNDSANCGGCGVVCTADRNEYCQYGKCRPASCQTAPDEALLNETAGQVSSRPAVSGALAFRSSARDCGIALGMDSSAGQATGEAPMVIFMPPGATSWDQAIMIPDQTGREAVTGIAVDPEATTFFGVTTNRNSQPFALNGSIWSGETHPDTNGLLATWGNPDEPFPDPSLNSGPTGMGLMQLPSGQAPYYDLRVFLGERAPGKQLSYVDMSYDQGLGYYQPNGAWGDLGYPFGNERVTSTAWARAWDGSGIVYVTTQRDIWVLCDDATTNFGSCADRPGLWHVDWAENGLVQPNRIIGGTSAHGSGDYFVSVESMAGMYETYVVRSDDKLGAVTSLDKIQEPLHLDPISLPSGRPYKLIGGNGFIYRIYLDAAEPLYERYPVP